MLLLVFIYFDLWV